MPTREQLLWELTVEANIEGVGVDRELVDGALYLDKAEQAALLDEAQQISGLDNPKSVQQLLKWLCKELDTDEVTDLKKATVSDLLKAGVDSDKAQRMLELRQLMSKTSTKKYDALQAAVCDDGRVRGMMFYYGANRSGRWAGRIVQPQNLPQNHLPELDLARQLVKKLDAEMLKVCYGSVPDTLSQLIRTAFIPRPGKLYAVADYSAIEARVVAWLAGETWVLDAFRAGKDIYCATASQMFGVPVEKHGVNSELRQRGKVATLALGYGGGESALVAMGALKMGIPEEDLPEIKAKWRQANPAICGLWRKIEDAAILCVRTGERQAVPVKTHDPERARANEYRTGATMGTYSDYFNTGVGITFRREADAATGQDFLTVELPTGRKLFYAHPQLLPARNFPDRESLHYMSTNQTTKKWGLTDTWGGKLVENITQAVARDCLGDTLLALRRRGMNPVFHVHDEVICEVDGPDRLQEILDIMATPLDWAPGLPLKGAGFTCKYYQKD
jgi:DNA polymerase